MDGRAAEEFYERTGAETSLDVNGIWVGEPRTIVPSVARAHLSVRLAPGQSAAEVAVALEWMLRSATPAGAEVAVEMSLADPALFDPGHPALRLAAEAIERACGNEVAFVRLGGTLPVLAELAERRIPDRAERLRPATTTPSTLPTRASASRACASASAPRGRSTPRWRPCRAAGESPPARCAGWRSCSPRTASAAPLEELLGRLAAGVGHQDQPARAGEARAAAPAAGARCAARRARRRPARGRTGARSSSGPGARPVAHHRLDLHVVRERVGAPRATASGAQSVASTRPPARAAAMLGSARPQPSSSVRAPRRDRIERSWRQRHPARPQLRPVGQQLLALEGLLARSAPRGRAAA